MKKLLVVLMILLSCTLYAQTKVTNFTLTDISTMHPVSLDQYTSAAAVVVLFTSNACPFDGYYRERIDKLINDYKGRAQFLLVNAHLDSEESEEKMKEAAAGWGLAVPYLSDKDQVAMTSLGARRSPEAFILRHEKNHFVVVYGGAIDDNPQEPAAVTNQHLRDALERVLSGKHAGHHQVRAFGCTIRKK